MLLANLSLMAAAVLVTVGMIILLYWGLSPEVVLEFYSHLAILILVSIGGMLAIMNKVLLSR